HLVWAPAILIIGLRPESGDLKLMLTFHDHHHAEFFPDRNRARKELFHLLWKRRRSHVVVLRLAAKKDVTHAAAHPEGSETSRLQAADNFGGSFAQGVHDSGINPRSVSHVRFRF